MRSLLGTITCILMLTGCVHKFDRDTSKNEIIRTEKEFEKMAAQKSIAEAFYFFADENAVIKREHDTLIMGKENILKYYENKRNPDVTLNWTPDFVNVSEDGTLGYTYGKYLWKSKDQTGAAVEYRGIFHTVWKRQKDGSWRYVWD
jgi:ketosteroid isomerase-like protein